MLHPDTRGRRISRAAYAAGALLALAAAAYLTYGGIDYAVRGCDCGEPLFGDWIWGVMLGLAAACYVAALALGLRCMRARR